MSQRRKFFAFSAMLKEPSVEKSRDYIVKRVCAGGNSKAPNREDNREKYSRNGSESESCYGENLGFCELPVEEYEVMMKTEQKRRDNYGYDNRLCFRHSEHHLEEHH